VFGARHGSDRLMSFAGLYVWALVGSSVGFYLFLYFISIGHALGILFPVAATLVRYLRHAKSISVPSVVHSVLVLAWAVRLLVFLLWREYFSWPALHAKILRVNAALHQKMICWFLYSFLYVCMLAPCWFRLESNVAAAVAATGAVVRSSRVGLTTAVGIALQVLGLLLESVADWQKSRFKALHRMEWCNTGLWKYSTHPNYAGEWLFWLGAVTASMPAILRSSSAAVALVKGLVVLIGFLFLTTILAGATQALEQRHRDKYGLNPEFCEFVARTGVFGPRRRKTTTEYNEPDATAEEWT
jgi:steroid 5-alpha reductase family enzyme